MNEKIKNDMNTLVKINEYTNETNEELFPSSNQIGATGVVTIEKIDINTNEVYETTEPEFNDICWPILCASFLSINNAVYSMPNTTPATGTPSLYWQILFATYDFKQDITNYSLPFTAAVNTNVGYPTFVAKTLPGDKDYVTFVADLLPTTSNRTIYGVGVSISYYGHASGPRGASMDAALTNLRLTTPCIQDTSTVVRVTYKIYLDDLVSGSGTISDSYYALMRSLFTATSNGGTVVPFNTNGYFGASSFYDVNNMTKAKPFGLSRNTVNFVSKMSDMGIINITNQSIFQNASQAAGTYAATDINSMGAFIRSLTLFNSKSTTNAYISSSSSIDFLDAPFANQKVLPDGTSPIQNIFKQTSSAPGPFQDLNSLGSSKGSISLDASSWIQSPYPSLYKINFVSGGTESTATYKIDKLSFTGGFVQNTYCPRDAILPQDGLTNDILCYHRNDFKDTFTFDKVISGGTTVRTPDNIKHFVTASCLRTKAAIAIYNVETGEKLVLNSASTPSLPVANVSDVAVSNGYIFVTCSTTGLWKIDPTFTTVTQLTTIGAGVDSSKAYQIDVKTNGDLWVLFEGGLCKGITADSGVTWSWTVYNTSNGFTATGITNSNWSNVGAMCVDPDHANDRILFVLGVAPTSTSNSASAYVWWERSTLTTTPMTTGISTTYTLANLLARSDILKCVNGYWFYNINQGVSSGVYSSYDFYMCTWSGATPPVSWTSKQTGGTISSVIRALPASVAGVNGAFFGTSNVYSPRGTYPVLTGSTSNNVTSAFFVNGSNFSVLPSTVTATSAEFFCKFGPVDTTTTAIQTYYSNNGDLCVNGQCPVVYLQTSNMMVYWLEALGRFSVSPLIIDPASTNYNTYKSVCWKSYGWDGSNWVLGNTNAKTCHTSSETFLDGLKISFVNGTTTPHFVAGESMSFVVGDGLMKDNATDYTFKFNYYPSQVERITDFYNVNMGGTTTLVPNAYYGQLIDEYVNFSQVSPNTSALNSTLRTQKKGTFSGQENGSTQFIGDNVIPDNTQFTLKFKFSSMPVPSSAFADERRMGVCTYSGSTYSANTAYAYVDATTGNLAFTGSGQSSYVYGQLPSIDSVISISRDAANKISFYVDGVLAYAFPTATSGNLYPFVQLTSNVSKTLGFNEIKLTYFEPRRLVKAGNVSTSSGYFNSKFNSLTTTTLVSDAAISINGVAQSLVYKTAAEVLTTGQVKVLTGSGWIEFMAMPTITVSTSGSTKGAALFPVIASTKSVNKTVSIINAGSGYTNGTYPMTFTGGGGSGAVGTVTISGGVVTSATVTNGGSGYTTSPTIGIGGSPGTPTVAAVLTAFIGYAITSVTIIETGSGYTSTPTITFSGPTGTGGHTTVATATIDSTKSVNDYVTINNAGSGYTDGTYPLVFTGGSGTGAAGNVYIVGGIVRRVVITNGGSGYLTVPSLSFTGAGTPTVSAVFTAAIGYRIATVTISDNGSGYVPTGGQTLSGYVTAHYTP